MQAREVASVHYLMPLDTGPYPNRNYPMITQTTIPDYQLNLQTSYQAQDFSPPSSCLSSNSTSDEAEEQLQRNLIDERKQRRMISNRESARRSRMRKQKHLDELWSQVVWLRKENHQLIDKLSHVSECHGKVLQENVQLKEEASELRGMLTDMQLHSPNSTLRDLEDVHWDIATFLIAESSDLLH